MRSICQSTPGATVLPPRYTVVPAGLSADHMSREEQCGHIWGGRGGKGEALLYAVLLSPPPALNTHLSHSPTPQLLTEPFCFIFISIAFFFFSFPITAHTGALLCIFLSSLISGNANFLFVRVCIQRGASTTQGVDREVTSAGKESV